MLGKTDTEQAPAMTRRLAFAFAVAAGVAIGNIYWSQPLLAQMAAEFRIETARAGTLFTATQVGYALGILLLVPLGDIVSRRKLVTAVMSLSAVALATCAVAPTFAVLTLALWAVGATTVGGQVIVPLAGDLSPDDQRGGYVGIVAGGIMLGILLARTISGLVAGIVGWRAVYWLAATITIACALAMLHMVPEMPAREKIAYPRLIVSVFTTVARTSSVPRILLMNGLVFFVFNLAWTVFTFLLAAESFGFDTFKIGLLGLAGIGGAAAAVGVGRLADKGVRRPTLLTLTALYAAGALIALPGSRSIVAVAAYAILTSFASQGIAILNQTHLFEFAPSSRSRLNTAFVVTNFVFGAIGSAAAQIAWRLGGWNAVCTVALIVSLAALVVLVVPLMHEETGANPS